MKIRVVKPVGDRLIPFPKPPYAGLPAEGARVEFPGDDGYWLRLQVAGVITVENHDALVVPTPSKKKEA